MVKKLANLKKNPEKEKEAAKLQEKIEAKQAKMEKKLLHLKATDPDTFAALQKLGPSSAT